VAGERESRDPAVQRRRLRTELRQARQQAEMTQKDVARALDWSPSKLIRIESGAVGLSTTDLKALLQHYHIVDQARIDSLVDLARASRTPGWSEYKDVVHQGFLTMLGHESSASIVRQYQPALVPGLLQTEEYARAILRKVLRTSGADEDKLWELRERRQRLHERENPPAMFFVVDEAVVRRLVGGPGVMRRQLEKLREFADLPHVTILVIPFAKGAHQGMTGPIVILEFPDAADANLVYLENARGDSVFRDEPQETDRYLAMFFELEDDAVDADQSKVLLDKLIAELQESDAPARSNSAEHAAS
jgi:transcriptional regulator with XRE-family HTH domain